MLCRAPKSQLFPYTTLFRSHEEQCRWRHRKDSTAESRMAASNGKLPCSHPAHRCDPRTGRRQPLCCESRSEEHTSELQSLTNLVCRLLLEKKKKTKRHSSNT